MAMPLETSHLDFLALNSVFSEMRTIKNFPLYEAELLGNAVKPWPSFSEVCILPAYDI